MTKQNRKLHIAFLDFDDIRNSILNGGQARATFEVARRLVKLGHQVTIICSRFPGSKDRTEQGIFYKHIGLGSSNVKVNNAFWFLALPFAVMRLKADVIIEAFTAPISTSFAPLFTRVPVIGMPTMFEAEQFSKKYHLPLHWIEALGCKFYKYFLAYSPINKKKMKRLSPRVHSRIIPNGVGEEMFGMAVTEGNYGLFIGRIDINQKGLDLLMTAIEAVKNKLPIKIVLAGNGPKEDEAKLLNLIAEKKLEEIVSFVGRVDGQKKADLLANCMFGLYPSRFEDFPLVPLEFAGLGKPLVCFDIPGLAWVPTDISIKAQRFEPLELAKAILAMATDEALRQSKKEKARPFAHQYGWDSIASQYADFCREVVEINRGARTRPVEATI